MIFANDFVQFNKGYVKSMGDAAGAKSLLCVPHESHRRIRRILSETLSLNSLSVFVQKFDIRLCKKLMKLEQDGKSFCTKILHEGGVTAYDCSQILEQQKKLIFEAMCNMLMSITDESLLKQFERECADVSNAMLSFPVMVPRTRYYKGIKEFQKPCTFIPFGYGPRSCLGINMAKVTMLVFLHRLTSGYKWTVDDLDPRLEKKVSYSTTKEQLSHNIEGLVRRSFGRLCQINRIYSPEPLLDTAAFQRSSLEDLKVQLNSTWFTIISCSLRLSIVLSGLIFVESLCSAFPV